MSILVMGVPPHHAVPPRTRRSPVTPRRGFFISDFGGAGFFGGRQPLMANVAIFLLALSLVACGPKPPSNFVATDPANRSNSWALQRADIDCKAEARSKSWSYRWHLSYRADADCVACMEQKGFVKTQIAQ